MKQARNNNSLYSLFEGTEHNFIKDTRFPLTCLQVKKTIPCKQKNVVHGVSSMTEST